MSLSLVKDYKPQYVVELNGLCVWQGEGGANALNYNWHNQEVDVFNAQWTYTSPNITAGFIYI